MPGRGLWGQWVLVVSAGEVAGFVVPALAALGTVDRSPTVQLLAMAAAGLAEGAALGATQAVVLVDVVPGLRVGAWVTATSLSAGVAWLLGMTPQLVPASARGWPWWVTAPGSIVLGGAILLVIGVAQVSVLPRGVAPFWPWVGWTALGWGAGLLAFMAVATPAWHTGQSPWLVLGIGLGAALLMAVTMAAVTGVGAVRLARHARRAIAIEQPAVQLLSALVGAPAFVGGNRVGRVLDLVADLAVDAELPPVTHVVVQVNGCQVAPWRSVLRASPHGLWIDGDLTPWPGGAAGPTRLLLARDLLDSLVVTHAPARRRRVNEVVLRIGAGAAQVTGADLSGRALEDRLLRWRAPRRGGDVVTLGGVRLLSRGGQLAQAAQRVPIIGVPSAVSSPPVSAVLADVVTLLPVAQGRALLRELDQGLRHEVLKHLHPGVASRMTGAPARRRTRRLAGWRSHPGRGLPRPLERRGDRT